MARRHQDRKQRISIATVKALKKAIAQNPRKSQVDFADEFGISRSMVSEIITGRAHAKVPWPDGYEPVPNRPGGQRKDEAHDPTNVRIMELEADLIHVTHERNRERAKNKAAAKTLGLFRAVVDEMEQRVKPFEPPSPAIVAPKKGAIKEHLVMHLSDGHHDQVVDPKECAGLEEYNFPISCARAERYVDTVLEWVTDTLNPKFHFPVLWVLAYGDHTSGEIHGHAQRSYYRNQFSNCLAIGQLHALMLRDLAPHFDRINVIYLPGNHGRRSPQKDFHGALDNWDTMIGEVARMHCREMKNVHFTIPNAYAINLNINGIGFSISHGDDVRGNGGVPFYGMLRRQKGLIALNSVQGGVPIRYFVMGHHHVAASLSDINGELITNGAWVGTDSYAYNSFAGYREPCQWLHGVHPRNGVTWRLNVKLKHPGEQNGPKRYKIDGGRDVGPLLA